MDYRQWYAQLKKPVWSPPSWLFSPVWGILYLLIFISFGKVFIMIWQKEVGLAMALPFVLNLIFNASFTTIQFNLKNLLLASLDIVLIWGTLVWAMFAIYPYAPWLALIQLPYLLWVSFAAVLQFTVTYLNRK